MGLMKKYSQFLKELPSKSVVFAFGRFNPPTSGHELLIKAVKKLAATNKAEHAIYASKSQDAKKNPLTVDKKVHYLNLMFPNTHFVAANPNVRTFIEAAKELNKKYKNLIMVAGSDRVPEYERILNTYNGKEFHFDTVQVISAGERDPDADDASGMSASKMRALASKGDYAQFKHGLPSTMRDIDGRRLMNDVRQGMGLEVVKEQINLVKDDLREQYFRGEIFNMGDIVESAGVKYEIVKRGSNHLLLKNTEGKLVSKWIQDVQLSEDVAVGYAPAELTFNGYTTKNLHHSEDAVKAFQQTIQRSGDSNPEAVLAALKETDTYMGLNDLHLAQRKDPTEQEIATWIQAHDAAKSHLESIGEFMHHRDYWDNHMHELEDMLSTYDVAGQDELRDSHEPEGTMLPEELSDKTLKSQDKIKVARIIATMLGIENAESSANPENLVNLALRKVRTKTLNPDSLRILDQMLKLADEVSIKYDATLKPTKLKEAAVDDSTVEVKKDSTYNAAKGNLRYSDYIKLKAMNTHTKPGHSMVGPHHDDSDRRQRIQYVSEEEQLDEISNKLAGNYYGAVVKQHMKKVGGVRHNMYDRMEKDLGAKRKQGVDRALDRITGARKTNEAIEPMDPVCEECGKVPCVCDEQQLGANNAKIDVVGESMEATATPHAIVDMAAYEADYENNMEGEEISDEDLDSMAAEIDDLDDVIDAYDDEELAIVDDESGEEIEDKMNESALMEVLSRMERMKAKARFARTAAKRERSTKIALRSYSSSAKINKRARRLAIQLMKKRLLKGRDPSKIPVGEKERIERTIEKRKSAIGRLAMRLAPRVRGIEKARMSHKKFTKAAPTV